MFLRSIEIKKEKRFAFSFLINSRFQLQYFSYILPFLLVYYKGKCCILFVVLIIHYIFTLVHKNCPTFFHARKISIDKSTALWYIKHRFILIIKLLRAGITYESKNYWNRKLPSGYIRYK